MLWVENLMTSFVQKADGFKLENVMIGSYLNYAGFKIWVNKVEFSEKKDLNVTRNSGAWVDIYDNNFHILECYILPISFKFEVDYNYQIMECYVYSKPSLYDGHIIGKFAVMRDITEDTVVLFLHH